MSAANRRRGHDCERAVVNYLRAQGWPDARRYLSGDGRQPGDIDFHPLICLEVKDVASSAWPTWCRQAAAEAPAGTVPVVVRRTRGVTDVGAWECRIDGGAWLLATDDPDTQLYPWPLPSYAFGPHKTDVDGCYWRSTNVARFVAAVRAVDSPPAPAVEVTR